MNQTTFNPLTLFVFIFSTILQTTSFCQVVLNFDDPNNSGSIPCNTTIINNGIPIQTLPSTTFNGACSPFYDFQGGIFLGGKLSFDVSSIPNINSVSFFVFDNLATNEFTTLGTHAIFFNNGVALDTLITATYNGPSTAIYENTNNYTIDEITIESLEATVYQVVINTDCDISYNIYTSTTSCGANNGTAEIIFQSGDITNVEWSNGISQGNQVFGLANGVYEVSVSDASGCSDIRSFIIEQGFTTTKFEQKINNTNITADDRFGERVAIHGNWAAISAFRDDENGANSGSVYIYRRNGYNWDFFQHILPSEIETDDQFGKRVSIYDDKMLIGAWADDDMGSNSGAVYAFQFNGAIWDYQQKIFASDASGGDNFGDDVAIYENRAIVGASRDNTNAPNAGAAYLFELTNGNWVEQQKIITDDGQDSDRFGFAVDIWDKTVIVGAYFDDDGGIDSGSAYIFRLNLALNQWEQQQKFVPANLASDDRFGISVAIANGQAIVGAPRSDVQGANSGNAYIFSYNSGTDSWTQNQEINPLGEGAEVGNIVDISLNRVLISADGYGNNTGLAYIYDYDGTTWSISEGLIVDDIDTNDNFSLGSALDGNNVLLGARNKDDFGNNSGAAYFFTIPNNSGDSDLDGICDDFELCPNQFYAVNGDCFCYSTCSPIQYEAVDYQNGDFYSMEASKFIIGSNIINAGAGIGYKAGEAVILQAGFEVELGAEFDAFIGPCWIICE